MAGTARQRRIIGRDTELAHARRLLTRDARLVTFVGPPGVGKTIVARQLAHELDVEGLDVRFVPLRDVSASGVAAAVARAIGASTRARGRDAIVARVAERMDDRATVLLLDECEHVREEVAELATTWLDATARPRIVVTSRERLDVPAEHVVRLDPFPSDVATALLRDALDRAGSKHDVSEVDARELVTRVDGLPLGIELLASRVAALGAPEVLATTAKSLSLPALEEALEDSFRMLRDDARFAFAAFSVPRGGFSLDVATRILDLDIDAARALADLVDASLVRRVEGAGARSRFEMLTVIRTFAGEKLAASGRSDEIARRHRSAFVRLAESNDDLTAERANLLAAFDFAKRHDDVRAAQHLAVALDKLLVRQGPPDLHRDVMVSALDLSATRTGDPALEAELHRAYGRFLALRGRFREALEACTRAAALARKSGDRRVAAWIASFECFVRRPLGELDAAYQAGCAALAHARELHDLRLEAMTEQSLGLVDHARGELDHASRRYLSAIAAAQRCGDERTTGIALANRALTLLVRRELAAAQDCYTRAHASFEASGDRYHLARIGPLEVAIARTAGDLEEAESRFASMLDTVRDQGDVACETELLLEGARVASLRGARAQAEARLAEARLLARDIEDVFLAADLEAVRGEVDRAERGELTLEIRANGSAAELRGGVAGRVTIDLSRRAALRRILLALAERHGQRGLTLAEVLEAGWPGERMRPESASARVYMAIRRLRALGLEEVLVTTEDGYALSSLVRVANC